MSNDPPSDPIVDSAPEPGPEEEQRGLPWSKLLLVAGVVAGLFAALALSSPSDAAGAGMVPGLILVVFVVAAVLMAVGSAVSAMLRRRGNGE